MFKLRGVIPPMITPFQENGELDEPSLRSLVEYLSQHVDGLFICGSYGCGALMTVEERKHVAELVRQYAPAETVVVVQTGAASTRETIELTRHVCAIGCDAAAAVGPYYYHYADVDVLNHYTAVLEAVPDLPFYAYYNPKFQGYNISLHTLKALKSRGLSGLKDATFDILQYATYQRELGDENFDVALGTEAIWVPAHALGCEAYIPGIGNVFPDLCKDMWTRSMNGDAEGALDMQHKINRIREIMYMTRSTQLAIYAIAELLGIMKAYPRAPFVPATETEKANITCGLHELGLL